MNSNRGGSRHGRGSVVVLLVGIGVLLAGCGGNDDAGDTAPSTTTTTTRPATTSTTGASTAEPAAEQTVEVYFSTGDGSDCSEVQSFTRNVPEDVDPIRAAFDQLVGGPTDDETAAGAGSFFSTATAAVLESAMVTDGLLTVDFVDLRPLLNNASTSCGSEALLAQLNNTAFQFEAVERVRYQIERSCDDFGNWLQRECFDIDRAGRQLAVPTNERASGSGCTPPTSAGLPDGRWYGFITDAQPDQVTFDLACWFTGTAADAAADEDGQESPAPNDFHIRNDNDRLRTLTVDTSAEVAWLPDPGDPGSSRAASYEDWRAEQATRTDRPGVWVTIDDERVISIEEQYVP